MCAAYLPTTNAQWVETVFGLSLPVASAEAKAEVYPGHSSPVVVKSHRDGRLAIGPARFGLVPGWAKDTLISRYTYNARSETADEKPSFRTAWRKRQFALVLVDAFFEPSYATGRAERWQIESVSQQPLGIASLWDRWHDPHTGLVVVSFAMLTVNAQAHPVMHQFHKPEDEKRTPLVLPSSSFDAWLSTDSDSAKQLLRLESMPALTAAPAPMRPTVSPLK
jgi:putative SOS response-associated peptidase YedK